MLIQFQIIHNFPNLTELELLIKNAIEVINKDIIKEHPPFIGNEVESPISFNIKYFKNGNSCNLAGVCLDYYEYAMNYYSDGYDTTIGMGFDWGAGAVIDEFNQYLYKFIDLLKQNNNIFEIIKFEDTNQKFAYWQLFKEIYEIEMQLREIISYLLFDKTEKSNLINTIKEKLVFKHRIDKAVLNRNCENEIFSLDFTHYKKIFETYPELFDKEIIKYVDYVRNFRNSLMHNKGFTNINPESFWNAKENLIKFINDFWIINYKK